VGFPRAHSLLWASTCSSVGSSKDCRWISVPLWTSMDCRGITYLTMVFFTGCRGICAPVPGAPPPSPASRTLLSAELFLSHILIPLSGCSCRGLGFFLILKYVMTEVLSPSLMSLALTSSRSVLEPVDIGSAGSF